MDLLALLQAQLTDPFRVGLLVALMVTTFNTAKATGYFTPLILGGAFVAILLPTTFPDPSTSTPAAIAAGLVSNAILLAVGLGAVAMWRRFSRRSQ